MLSAIEKKRKNTEGVLVQTMREGGPAKEAKPSINNGDIIISVNGRKIKQVGDLRELTDKLTSGKAESVPVTVGFERDTKEYLTVVKIGKSPDSDKPAIARKAWLPAATQVLTMDLSKAIGMEGKKGVRVTKVYKGHSAETAGMKAGDILLKADGEIIDACELHHSDVLATMMKQYKIGSEVDFDVVRDGKPMNLKVKLEESQKVSEELKSYKDEKFEITVRELSFDDKVSRELEEDFKGVIMDRIEYGSWFMLAHACMGDLLISIDGQPTPDVDSVEKILNSLKEKKPRSIVLFVRREIHTLYLEVEPVWEK
jgi:S1-C subfamily serine protease